MKDKKTLLILIPFLLFVIIVGALAIVGDRIPDNPPETTVTPCTPWILRSRISKNWAMLP